jgi:hypothetical protein
MDGAMFAAAWLRARKDFLPRRTPSATKGHEAVKHCAAARQEINELMHSFVALSGARCAPW